MTRFLQPLRMGRQIAMRSVVARVPAMTRGYPSRSEMNEDKADVSTPQQTGHMRFVGMLTVGSWT